MNNAISKSPILFGNDPEEYRRLSYKARLNLLQKYTSYVLREPSRDIRSIRNRLEKIINKAQLPLKTDSYLNHFLNQGMMIPLGGKSIQADLNVLIAISNLIRGKKIKGKRYHTLLIVMWGYYVLWIAHKKQNCNNVELKSKSSLYNITGLEAHTLLKAEKILSGWGILKKSHSHSNINGSFKTSITFSIDFSKLDAYKLKNNSLPESDAKTSALEGTKYKRRHQRFIKEHSTYESFNTNFKPVKAFRLFTRHNDQLYLQVDFANPYLILRSLWSEKSLKNLLGFNDSRVIKAINLKSIKWLDNHLPYYPLHRYDNSEVSVLKNSIRPALKSIAKTGIGLDTVLASSKLQQLKQERETFMREMQRPKAGVYELYKKARGRKKAQIKLENPEIKNEQQIEKFNHQIQTLHRYISRAKSDTAAKLYPKLRFGYSTNRILTFDENIQGIPKKLQYLFKAPKNRSILRLDIKQQDLTVIILLSKDENGLSMLQKEIDIYELIARHLNIERDQAKKGVNAYNFGSNGTRINSKLTEYLGGKVKVRLFHEWMTKNLPKVVAFRENAAKYAKETGMTFPTPHGYSYPVQTQRWNKKKKEWVTVTPGTKSKGYPVQATSAELMMLIVRNLYTSINDSIKIVAPVHDEIILEIDETQEKQATRLFKSALAKAELELFGTDKTFRHKAEAATTLGPQTTNTQTPTPKLQSCTPPHPIPQQQAQTDPQSRQHSQANYHSQQAQPANHTTNQQPRSTPVCTQQEPDRKPKRAKAPRHTITQPHEQKEHSGSTSRRGRGRAPPHQKADLILYVIFCRQIVSTSGISIYRKI